MDKKRLIATVGGGLPLAGLWLLPSLAMASTPTLNSGDTAWMLTSTALVLLMTVPGVALFYGGMVRRKNLLSVAAATFAVTCLITAIWAIAGYSLAFKGDGPFVGNLSALFLKGMGYDTLSGSIPESVFMTFQMTFAIITPALIIGAVVERMKFSALLWFLGLWSLLVYSPIAHMVWGGGWLGGDGVQDFAGGTVVHINAGVAGLVAALMLGKRKGYGTEPMPPVNLVYTMTGAALLWVGWFGFNAGSELAADGTAGMAMAVTQIATGVAALSWMFVEWAARGKPTLLGMSSGAVAGLVAITPASGFVGPIGAFVIGIAAGLGTFWASVYLKKMLGYDDSLDAFGVHAVGGIIGALLTGVFSAAIFGGAGLSSNAGGSILHQFWIQCTGVGFTIVYDAIMTFIIIKVLDVIMGVRVTEEQESEGLDTSLHGEQIYE
ncbi:ammonium transporter [Acidihalobacter ferrooxydans]|uniref:Ammonium transporter n=1 Tax=Acidihalobacter ferrooxydans TaxID=1765967 RepID=A0A1P8UDU8_9GAMM|nr:ammonium transporter [Acidihalobacter ferrooxydans]APZ41958.1 ammonia channel protein [Acidihalobacter ferrooxydans]